MRPSLLRAMEDAERLVRFMQSDIALSSMEAMCSALEEAFRGGNKALACGNGGSMADAMHFAEEWTGRFRGDRRPMPAIALCDPTALTCIGNDYGFEQVFARQVEALGQEGDVLFLMSTTGNSKNLVKAAEAAKKKGVKTIGLLGRDGGELRTLCDLGLIYPGDTSDRIQEMHMLTLHALIEAVEKELGL